MPCATSWVWGTHSTQRQILAPFKRMGLVEMAVALNLIVAPITGWGLTRVVPMDPGYAPGIWLVAFAPAAPASLKFAQIGRGDVPLAVSLVVLLSVLNIAAIPLWSALLMPSHVSIKPLDVASTLLVNVLPPLRIGLSIKPR